MKKILSFIALILLMLPTSAQVFKQNGPSAGMPVPEVVNWTASYKMLNATAGIITIEVHIYDGWHIYGTKTPKNGPIATKFTFSELTNVKLVGKTSPSKKAKSHFDRTFNKLILWWEGNVKFTQLFKVINPSKEYAIGGSVKYMSCNEEKQKCNPPKTFEFKFKQ